MSHGKKRNSQRLSGLTVYRTAEPYSPRQADHMVNFRPHFRSYRKSAIVLKGGDMDGWQDIYLDELNRKHVDKPQTE
jgi:hypothetical protein